MLDVAVAVSLTGRQTRLVQLSAQNRHAGQNDGGQCLRAQKWRRQLARPAARLAGLGGDGGSGSGRMLGSPAESYERFVQKDSILQIDVIYFKEKSYSDRNIIELHVYSIVLRSE